MADMPDITHRFSLRVPREIWIPGVILSTVGILLRILVATRRDGIEIDGIAYLHNAEAMMQDWGAINILHPPLYSMVLAPFYTLWSDPEWGARVISSVLGGLWVWPTLWLARETTNERVAWSAGLLVCLMPAAIMGSTLVLSEALYGLCLTSFLLFFIRALKTGCLATTALAGVLGGLATLTRPEGMGYLSLAWVLLLLAPVLIGKQWNTQRVVTRIATITILWLLVLFPYMLAIWKDTGHWHWSGKVGFTLRWAESVGREQPNAFVEQVITETREEELPRGLFAYVMERPTETAWRATINLHLVDKYVLPGLLHSAGIALVLLGFIHLRFRSEEGPPEWTLAAALLPLGGLLLFVVETRYFLGVVPALSVIAGIGLARAGRPREWQISNSYTLTQVVVLSVVLLSFAPWIVRPWFRQDPAAVEKAAGLWLRESTQPGEVFIGRYPRIGYYAGTEWIPIARRSLEDLLIEGRERGARFLIADSVSLPQTRPDLVDLSLGNPSTPDLKLVHVEAATAGHRVLIYGIQPPKK